MPRLEGPLYTKFKYVKEIRTIETIEAQDSRSSLLITVLKFQT